MKPIVDIKVIVMVDGQEVQTITPADLEGVLVDDPAHLIAAMQASTVCAVYDAVYDRLAAK